MDNKIPKIIIIIITFFAIGVLVLPSTASLFAGQHLWYDLSGQDNDVPCVKCHADVHTELMSSYHRNIGCSCHRADINITYAEVKGTAVVPGKQAHAASTVACMLCHQYNGQQAIRYVEIPLSSLQNMSFAGGFEDMSIYGSPYNYTDPNASDAGICEAHNSFVRGAIVANNGTLLPDSSEACVACHMMVNLTINFNISSGMLLEVNHVIPGYSTVTGFNESYLNITSSKYAFVEVEERRDYG
ncbi:hypothetical protein [Archaeoglobus veneficus]|uniref:Uncharacterized protein n=1 Tax=Archaeoglobus veneficus (strain DSM 11195 / SNP6) TaxID=693661 RepID=F2KRJ1_ARCVS|nr:hypothetical protein [Archaeoglobus veneficus]AEA46756.1 hypothetical protein Arcve_0738 [Archaeoglobus veneficus SNP6]